MDIEDAIRTRRTHTAFRPEPVDRKTLDELFELARWAPNHHGTNPWRFRVLGPGALAHLKHAAGSEQESKLSRAPTLVVVSAALSGDPLQDEEDLHATASPRTSFCSSLTREGSPATGARQPSYAPSRAVPPWGSPTRSMCWALSTSVGHVSRLAAGA